ncbi:ATP-binding protein [Pseudohongiella spirulinae]|uniref:histidine kinase n=1 Tax=Pseudohongiella spirulinae TaxID=1249552 RepID=A0A0S2KCC5_9GAMM|nr:ATP-binding protein [Pseudohongiella spirulinae]ALO45747.1 HAMP domain protein [Pseudohongiella spirulinae]
MKNQLSSWLFFRSYSVIAAGILIVALALDSLLLWLLPDNQQSSAERYSAEFAFIELILAGEGEEPGAVSRLFETMQPTLEEAAGVPVSLYEVAEMGDQQAFLTALRSGTVQTFIDGNSQEILYRMLPSGEQLIALGPLPAPPVSQASVETLVIVSYYLLVALLLFLWLRPFYRDLSALRHAASQFGRDDFETRVAVGSNSSILPVASSFNKMAERIQYLVTAHRDLTNAVAHELHTPLARFKFGLEMIPKMEAGERLTEHLNGMKSDVQELEELIDEMLTYARLSEDNLQLQLHTVRLNDWLKLQLAQYRDSQPPVLLNVKPEDDLTAVAFNPELLARAIHNIVRNCLRYAVTEVTVSCLIRAGEVKLCIFDDGPGIPEADWQRVFEPFARLDTSRDRQSGGYGLGLAIAKRILQRHGGDIHLAEHSPQGACFVLSWPYN